MTFSSFSLKQTANLAELLASTLKGGEVILLNGNLGAGKTAFTKELFRVLGVKELVLSPSFTLIKEYNSEKFRLYHIDMYRIDGESLQTLGIEDFLFEKDAITVIEWNKQNLCEEKTIRIDINQVSENERQFSFNNL
ncbi:MAG: tRNA (adenosine(37)-N6)-threonylcarbamoyltransferase complex ATPase subunit type 1 TsaE [Firmicutes bacterium]|nr:tRNA (adenosine(37)-N6)-threonylcarbamoyltransferase complex ATPase subunit type 1 TsaE [Bacillota bacterium]